jgi:hypothetical protein
MASRGVHDLKTLHFHVCATHEHECRTRCGIHQISNGWSLLSMQVDLAFVRASRVWTRRRFGTELASGKANCVAFLQRIMVRFC